MSNESGWNAHTGADITSQPELRQLGEQAINGTPIAQITIRIFGLDRGQSELRVDISPDGAMKDALETGAVRSKAYARLLEIVQREVQLGLTTLQQH